MKILITGASGFIAKNLIIHLQERSDTHLLYFRKGDDKARLFELVAEADFIFHLAAANRPQDPQEFNETNAKLTADLCEALREARKSIPIVFSSSTQALLANPYGESKREAEKLLEDVAKTTNCKLYLFRLPNVFGKWTRPNYNSAVATFCYNTVHAKPLVIHNPHSPLTLVYIDDLMAAFLKCLENKQEFAEIYEVQPSYQTTVGEVAALISSFPQLRETMQVAKVGQGLIRALYATYLSYLPPASFSYSLVKHEDPRGVFVEMLKTPDCGQFSYFTAKAGITRGGHYHHTKAEKFLVIKGQARFAFKHILSGDYFEILTCGTSPQVVETVPGWSHNITNIGDDEMLVLLWANEVFDKQKPDTVTHEV